MDREDVTIGEAVPAGRRAGVRRHGAMGQRFARAVSEQTELLTRNLS